MDANAKLDRIVVGLRSGLIVVFNLTFDQDSIVNVDEVELGVSLYISCILVSYKLNFNNKNIKRWNSWSFRWP